ncbi:MAG: enoyl-CoA hydratase/isomerase family protein [Roseiarcus sp.]
MSGNALQLTWPEEDVALVTFTRADSYNTLSMEMLSELEEALDIATNMRARAMILTGSGRAFCAGADLNLYGEGGIMSMPPLDIRDKYLGRIALLCDRLEEVRFPVIAAINGFALGGGLEIALSCDFRIMSRDTKIGLPEVRLGATPGAGGVQKLGRFVGRGKALEWILLGKHVTAEEAETHGLLYKTVGAEEVLPAALELAVSIKKLSPMAIGQCKMSIHLSGDVDGKSARRFGLEALTTLIGSRDWQEGIRAFLEKRDPKFER